MQTASKNLMETLSDIYEKEWVGQDMLYVQVVLIGIWSTCAMITFQAQNNEMLWADLAHKLSDQVVIPLNTYQAQFPEMRVSSWTIDICFSHKILWMLYLRIWEFCLGKFCLEFLKISGSNRGCAESYKDMGVDMGEGGEFGGRSKLGSTGQMQLGDKDIEMKGKRGIQSNF